MIKGKIIVSIVAGLLVLILGISTIVEYNGLVTKSHAVDNTYSQVINRLNERQATTTQLVSVISELETHELEIYTAITEARSAYADAIAAGEMGDIVTADAAYFDAMTNLIVTVENYPSIASSSSFHNLMVTISGIESALFVARKDYNDAVTAYLQTLDYFPSNIYAAMFNFTADVDYWALNEGADDIPIIDFGTYDDANS